MKVNFWFMRHGEKPDDGSDDITEFGREQVVATTVHWLAGSADTFVAAYHSGQFRAMISIRVAMSVLVENLPFVGDHEDELVGFKWLIDERYPPFAFPQTERELRERYGDSLTAYEWLKHWPPAWALRERLREFMFRESRALSTRMQLGEDLPNEPSILVGSHSPLAELAIPDPREAHGLDYADIVRYTVRIYSSGAFPEIVDVTHFPCPLHSK